MAKGESKGAERSISPAVRKFIESTCAGAPDLREVWLFGSRANRAQRSDSDWDLIAYGSWKTVEYLKEKPRPTRLRIDLLACPAGDTLTGIWEEKSGSLQRWKWAVIGDGVAEYDHNKVEPGRSLLEAMFETIRWRAYRVWPQSEARRRVGPAGGRGCSGGPERKHREGAFILPMLRSSLDE